MITQINIVKEPEYYYPAGLAEKDGLMTYQESQKLDSIPTPSNIVTKSSTVGLLKNNGTVDTNSYAKESIVASEFDETVTYVAGKYVIYQNQFYRCLLYCSGPWDPSHFALVDISNELFNSASFNKFYGSADYDGSPDYKIDHSYVHQGSSNIPPYPSDGKAGTTNRFGILKTAKMDTGYIFQTLIVSYEGEPSGDDPTIKTKFYYRSAIRINGNYVWGNWYETTGTEIV